MLRVIKQTNDEYHEIKRAWITGDTSNLAVYQLDYFNSLTSICWEDIFAYIDTVEEYLTADESGEDLTFAEMDLWRDKLNEIRKRLGVE